MSNQAKELNAYYQATRIQRSVIYILLFSQALLIAVLGFTVYYFNTTALVSVPGQTFKANRQWVDPYRQYNSEQVLLDFTLLMFGFDKNTYETALSDAQYMASAEVYNEYRSLYYEKPQPNTNEPAYFSWVRNELVVEVAIPDGQLRTVETENGFIHEFYGTQTFRKEYQYNVSEEIPIHIVARTLAMNLVSNRNRRGYTIVELELSNEPWSSAIEDRWEEQRQEKEGS